MGLNKGKRGHRLGDLTRRQLRFVEFLCEGASPEEAAKAAGYSKKSTRASALAITGGGRVHMTLIECLDKAGLTDRLIAEKIYEGTCATETRYFAEKGVVTDERKQPAWDARLGYLKTALQIKGYLTKWQMELTGRDGEPLAISIDLSGWADPLDAEVGGDGKNK